MEATFKGRLGQTVEISGSPEEIATAYAYLLAADISSIKAIEVAQSKQPPKPKNGGYVDPPKMKQFEGRDPEDIFDALLDWVNDQIRHKEDSNGEDE